MAIEIKTYSNDNEPTILAALVNGQIDELSEIDRKIYDIYQRREQAKLISDKSERNTALLNIATTSIQEGYLREAINISSIMTEESRDQIFEEVAVVLAENGRRESALMTAEQLLNATNLWNRCSTAKAASLRALARDLGRLPEIAQLNSLSR